MQQYLNHHTQALLLNPGKTWVCTCTLSLLYCQNILASAQGTRYSLKKRLKFLKDGINLHNLADFTQYTFSSKALKYHYSLKINGL